MIAICSLPSRLNENAGAIREQNRRLSDLLSYNQRLRRQQRLEVGKSGSVGCAQFAKHSVNIAQFRETNRAQWEVHRKDNARNPSPAHGLDNNVSQQRRALVRGESERERHRAHNVQRRLFLLRRRVSEWSRGALYDQRQAGKRRHKRASNITTFHYRRYTSTSSPSLIYDHLMCSGETGNQFHLHGVALCKRTVVHPVTEIESIVVTLQSEHCKFETDEVRMTFACSSPTPHADSQRQSC